MLSTWAIYMRAFVDNYGQYAAFADMKCTFARSEPIHVTDLQTLVSMGFWIS